MIARFIRRLLGIPTLTIAGGEPLRVEHVRYVKAPAISPRAKAHAMALAMGRLDLASRLEPIT